MKISHCLADFHDAMHCTVGGCRIKPGTTICRLLQVGSDTIKLQKI